MSADLGTGIACLFSIGPRWTYVSGKQLLGQSLARRLITPRGSLSWDPDGGTDLRDYLNAQSTPATRFALARAAAAECEKDERVETANVTAVFLQVGQQLQLTIMVTTADGPFQLVMTVDKVGVTSLAVT